MTWMLPLSQHSIITAHSMTHRSGQTAAKIEKVKRPTITAAGTSEEWTYFQLRWKGYVFATKLEGRDKVIQLLECCDEPLRKVLTRSVGTFTDKSEGDVMIAIKKTGCP